MKFGYKEQMVLTVVIMVLFSILNTAWKQWIFTSIGYCLCGALWLCHPVLPKGAKVTGRSLMAVRLAGGALILIGIIMRARPY